MQCFSHEAEIFPSKPPLETINAGLFFILTLLSGKKKKQNQKPQPKETKITTKKPPLGFNLMKVFSENIFYLYHSYQKKKIYFVSGRIKGALLI